MPPIRLHNAGGAGRDRTGDLLNANQALSQLSYSPIRPRWRGRKSNRGQLNAETMRQAHGLFEKSEELQVEIGSGLPARLALPKTEVLDRTNLTGAWSGTAASYLTPCTLNRDLISETPPTFSLRKEVIQPQVLLRLPCYDFTPIMDHTLGRCPPCGSACRLLVQSTFVM